MKTIIAFLLGYLAANWVSSKGGIKQAIASVQMPATVTPSSGAPVVNSTVNAPPSTMPVFTPYSPYSSLHVFRIQ